MKSTREAYGEALAELGEERDFIVLDADLSKATCTWMFQKAFPDRFFNMGISEADMMSTAAGWASMGQTVFASTFAMFAAGRAWEQVRNAVAYGNFSVKIAATHGGVLIGADGGSHQALEDIALMRSIPGMTVLVPADAEEARCAVRAAIDLPGPVYLRFGRFPSPQVYEKGACPFRVGKGTVVAEGGNVSLLAIGDMVAIALEAREILAQNGVSARVVDMCSVKPMDEALVVKCARETGRVVTMEDHSILGGLGGAVCELLSESCPVPVKRIGMRDAFGQSGEKADLAAYYGFTGQAVAKTVVAWLKA